MVLGANGQLGTDLVRALGAAAIAVTRAECDVRDADRVATVIREHRPAAVVNCAAATNVDGAEDEPRTAFEVNACAALHVARAADEIGATTVYVSTDYVFGSDACRLLPYVESDRPGPLNAYGASKLAGEHLTSAACRRTVVVRTASLYGHAGARGKGGNFVETMLRMAGDGRPLRVVCDQFMSPMSTTGCASSIVALLQGDAHGVHHIAPSDSCSWFEFACEIFRHYGLKPDLSPVPMSTYPTRARRPRFSALSSERPSSLGRVSWRTLLHEYLESRPARPAGEGSELGAGCLASSSHDAAAPRL
jgi:dTDP-4-dehydrorhamnose reductase